jgi:PAS domain S-box-containing protein
MDSEKHSGIYSRFNQFVLQAGVDPLLPAQISRRIWMTNVFSICLGTIVAPYTAIFWLLGSKLFGLICLPVALFYWALPLLNRKGYINFSRISFVLVAHFIVLFYAIAFGRKSGIYYLFFLTASYSILMFDKSERLKQLFSLFLTVISIGTFEVYNILDNPVPIVLPESVYEILNPLLFATTFILVGLINYFFYSANNKSQEALEAHSRKVEDLVRERTRDLEKSQQMAHLGNWTWDMRENRFEVSPVLLRILGLKENFEPRSLKELSENSTHPEDLDLVSAFLDEMKAYRVYQPIEYRIIRADGSIRWVNASVPEIIEKDASNKPRKIIGTILDITERKLAEEALKESELRLKREMALFEGFFSTIPEKMYIKNTQSQFLRINREMGRFFALKDEQDAVGKTDFDFFSPEHARQAYEDEQRIMQSGIPMCNYEEKETWPDGRITWALSTKLPLRDTNGKVTGLVGISIDITSRKMMEEALQENKEKLLAKNNELENYLYVASHDLRSPLVNIQGFSQRLQKQTSTLEQAIDPSILDHDTRKKFVEVTKEGIPKSLDFIFSNVSKMDTLINGLLVISRTGRIRMTIMPVDMNQLIGKIINTLNYQLEEAEAELIIHPLANCHGDADLLNQLFSNIIVNAIKYRDRKRRLRLEISSTAGAGKVSYSISDNGIGIPERHLKKIWDVFYRVDSLSPQAGEGIGLSIVKRIVDKHRGKVWVDSEEGKGSTFHISLHSYVFSE